MLASLVTGGLLSLATLALAGPVGGHLFGKASAELLRLISPVFLLAGLGAVSRGLLWRHLDFRRVSLIEMVSLALGPISAVAMALAGLAAEAIVLGALVATLTTAVLLLVSVPPPMPRFHREALRDVTGFGLPASAAGLTYVADQQRDDRGRRGAPHGGAGRPLLARLPARRRLPGQDQRDHDAARLPDLLADQRPRRAAPIPRARDPDPRRRPAAAALAADRAGARSRALGLRRALGAGRGCRPDPRGGGDDRGDPHRLPADPARRGQAASAPRLQPGPARPLRRHLLDRRAARAHGAGDQRRRRPRGDAGRRLRDPLPAPAANPDRAASSPTCCRRSPAASPCSRRRFRWPGCCATGARRCRCWRPRSAWSAPPSTPAPCAPSSRSSGTTSCS